jgi:hypothetical protein
MKKIIFGIAILAIAALGYLAYNQKGRPSTSNTNVSEIAEENKFLIDLDGNGEKEFVIFDMPEDEQDNYLKSIKTYSQSGEELASLPPEIGIKVPMSESIKIHKLNANESREYFSFDFIAGPHQSETMFFELRDELILPVCHKDEVSGPYDCLFYSGNTGYLPLLDLDNDGYLELIETVDEYPISGELSTEEESAITQAFDKQEVDEFTEGAEIIARREKGGRGRMVVWAIYSFNGKRFVEQTEENYEKYYELIGNTIENKMRKSKLSKNSLEYIQLVKDFWGHKEN